MINYLLKLILDILYTGRIVIVFMVLNEILCAVVDYVVNRQRKYTKIIVRVGVIILIAWEIATYLISKIIGWLM